MKAEKIYMFEDILATSGAWLKHIREKHKEKIEDNEYLDNEEQTELDEKASKVKIKLGARADTETKEKKPRTVKISDEKQHLFANIKTFLDGYCLNNGGNVRVEKENKLLILEINGKTFKIDLIEQRKPKK